MSAENIDTSKIYGELKDFQKITVDYAFQRLEQNKRFLVADEVGLGKTMVAKGIIAKFIDKYKKNLEILYITTNSAIAAQNIETLRFDDSIKTSSTRISLLINEKDSSDIKVRSFTIGTSLEFKGHATGIKEERMLLIFLLKKAGFLKGIWNKTIIEFFRSTAENFNIDRLDFNISDEFLENFKKEVEKNFSDIKSIIQKKESINETIRELRKILIRLNLQYLNPDLIILDEFQRFSHILKDDNENSDIVKTLFGLDNKILLLSATPYKLLDCQNNEHYDEFYSLLEWLYKDKSKVEELKKHFANLEKEKIEKMLLEVMCRNERFSLSQEDEITDEPILQLKITKSFLDEYARYKKLGLNLEKYLKSAPNPINYMKPYKDFNKDGYIVKKEFLKNTENKKAYKNIHTSHPKMDVLKKKVKELSLNTLIWMPPINSYIKTKKINNKKLPAQTTKILIFSKWDFVPDSIVGHISSLASYNTNTRPKLDFWFNDRLWQICKTNPYEKIYTPLTISQIKGLVEGNNIEKLLILASPVNVIYRSIKKYSQINDLKSEDIINLAKMFLRYLSKYENREKIKKFAKSYNPKQKLKILLEYLLAHDIQGMFDEYIHILSDSPKFKNKSDKEKIEYLKSIFDTVFNLRPNEIMFDEFDKEKKLSSRFVMRIGKSALKERADKKDKPVTAENVKTAFNSPFAPFVLATTSVGQEGLDFHNYCHQIWHFEIPSNPVDLEQREGRIHRYKNYALRKNIAAKYNDFNWNVKFEKAKKDTKSDFKTFWFFNGDVKIERMVPVLPFSKEKEKYEKLLKQLKLYRQVIGRVNQKLLMENETDLLKLDLKPKNL